MTKTALVTGANQGIGLATVQLLLELGHRVILTARDENKGLEVLKEINNPNCYFHQLDISDKKSIEKFKIYLENEFNSLDILINNAAINYDTWHNASEANLDEIEETIQTNLMGAWRVTQACLGQLKKSAFGNIVNVSSGGGNLASQTGYTPAYSISKLALNGLTLQLSNELKKDNIIVNSVCPGWVRTSMGGMGAPRSAQDAAIGIVAIALLENINKTGKFFRDEKEISW